MIHAPPGATIEYRFATHFARVAELLHQYFRIAFLMGRPQDLPGGRAQLQIGVVLAFATYMVALLGVYGFARSLVHVLLDLGCTGLGFYLALSLVGHPGRFEQAFGGLCGASAFVNAVAVPVYLDRPPAGAADAAPTLAEFVLLVWSLSLLAHVLRHTFGVRLSVGIGIAFLYVIVLTTLMDALLPSPRQDVAPSGHEEGLEEAAVTPSVPVPPLVSGPESFQVVMLLS